jgi:hypothetical protein
MFKKQIKEEPSKPAKPTVTLADIENAKFEIGLEEKAREAREQAVKHRQGTCPHERQELSKGHWEDGSPYGRLHCVICGKSTAIDGWALYNKLKEKAQ